MNLVNANGHISVAAYLASAGKGPRNARNNGRAFEDEIALTNRAYREQRQAKIEKVEQPIRITGTGVRKQVIHLVNPFLDLTGTFRTSESQEWRRCDIELKSTQGKRLSINVGSGGLTSKQVKAMHEWAICGSTTALLWECQLEKKVVMFSGKQILEAVAEGAKPLCFEDGIFVPRGSGYVIWDYLPLLEAA